MYKDGEWVPCATFDGYARYEDFRLGREVFGDTCTGPGLILIYRGERGEPGNNTLVCTGDRWSTVHVSRKSMWHYHK